MYGFGFSQHLKSLRKIRAEAMKKIGNKGIRNRFLKSVASEKMLKMLREKGFKEAEKLAEELFDSVKSGS